MAAQTAHPPHPVLLHRVRAGAAWRGANLEECDEGSGEGGCVVSGGAGAGELAQAAGTVRSGRCETGIRRRDAARGGGFDRGADREAVESSVGVGALNQAQRARQCLAPTKRCVILYVVEGMPAARPYGL